MTQLIESIDRAWARSIKSERVALIWVAWARSIKSERVALIWVAWGHTGAPMPTDPYAVVQNNSLAQKNLAALGWTVTDTHARPAGVLDPDTFAAPVGWVHMEPPTHTTSVVVEALNMRESDGLIVTAEGLDGRDVEMLRDQIDMLLAGHMDAIVSSFDIKVQVLRRDPVSDTA